MSAQSSGWAYHPLLASRRISFLDTPLHALSMDETIMLAAEAMARRRPMRHTVVNVAKLMAMRDNAELFADVTGSDVINIDGAGIVFGARLLGHHIPERVAGIDVMERLFALAAERGFRPFLLGAEQAVLDAVANRLRRDYPQLQLAGIQHGYFPENWEGEVVAAINASGADCLFVAMPTPRKERFLARHGRTLSPSFIMGVGGSFDVYGGKVRRAPRLVQKMGLEWAFRLAQEPRRLGPRYLSTNGAYLALLLRTLVTGR